MKQRADAEHMNKFILPSRYYVLEPKFWTGIQTDRQEITHQFYFIL